MLKTIVNLSLIALSICCTCFSPLSKAEKADRDKALVLNADAVSIDDVEQRYILKGEILLVKGSIVITGENADIQIHGEFPLIEKFKNRDEFLELAQNPQKNIFCVGEAFSRNQGWSEGALQSVYKILSKII